MIRYIPYSVIIIGICLFTTSCYMAGTMQTDVLKPAKISFSSKIYKVGVVSRMDLEARRTTGKIDMDELSIFERDSALLKNAVLGLLDGLAESPRFEAYEVKSDRVLKGRSSSLNEELSWELLEKLSMKDSLDMIISLTSATFTDTTHYLWSEMAYILYPKTFWRIYDLKKRKVSKYVFTDTLSYQAGSGRNSYPSRVQIIKNFKHALGITGYQFSRRLAPFWELEDRVWFPNGDYLFNKAGKYAKEGNWTEASAIWNKYAHSKKRTIAAKASFNMALASEMQDRLDLALMWLDSSKELGLSYYADYYIDIIKDRQQIQLLLDNQMK